MPLVTVDGPKIDLKQKRELVKLLTNATAKVYKFDKEHIIVLVRENAPENVGVGGQLVIDRRKKSRLQK